MELAEYPLDKAVKQFFDKAVKLYGYQVRNGQNEMAMEVSRAVTEKKPLAVEAEVGIGKSYAYLVPVLIQYFRERKQVIIATSTIALQEQLYRDAEKVMELLGVNSEIILAKGMKNYLCMKRLSNFRRRSDNLCLKVLWNWADAGRQDRTQIPLNLEDAVWNKLCVCNFGNRHCQQCAFISKCTYSQMRRKLLNGNQIVICNQNMLVSHFVNEQFARRIFSKSISTIIVDEAHNLEPRFRDAFTKNYTKHELIQAVKKCTKYSRVRNSNKIAETVKNDILRLFQNFRSQINLQQKQADGDVTAFFFQQNSETNTLMRRIRKNVTLFENEDELLEIYYFFREVMNADKKQIVWLEKEPEIHLCVCKKDIRPDISELLFRDRRCTILTSATISNSIDYSYFLNCISFPKNGVISNPKKSPFDYDNKTNLYCSTALPIPNPEQRTEYRQKSVPEILKLLEITDGRTLILFTSRKDMDYVYTKLSNLHLPYKILKQNISFSQEHQLEKFRNDVNSVILGTGTYWEGINIEGESLSQVIIYRLPFPVPDPILEYRMSQTQHSVTDVAVPEMIIRLRQGAGRLIRSETDKGIVSILDPRISSQSRKSYRASVLNSLPIKNRTENIEEIRIFWDTITTGGEIV